MSLRRAAGGECDNARPHYSAGHAGDRLPESDTYDLTTTTEIYSFLWQKPTLCDYVMAVAPSAILRHVMACRGKDSNAYIINVLRRRKSLKRTGDALGSSKKKKKYSPESPHCLQGPEGAGTTVCEGMSPRAQRGSTVGTAAAAAAAVAAAATTAAGGGPKMCTSRGEPTGHWVVLVINRTGSEIFDSLGEMNASIYGREVDEFVKENDCHFVNNEILDTKNCAFYCLLFCYYKCLGFASATVVEKLKKYRLNIVEKCKRVFLRKL